MSAVQARHRPPGIKATALEITSGAVAFLCLKHKNLLTVFTGYEKANQSPGLLVLGGRPVSKMLRCGHIRNESIYFLIFLHYISQDNT
jgi:hypothetical protein